MRTCRMLLGACAIVAMVFVAGCDVDALEQGHAGGFAAEASGTSIAAAPTSPAASTAVESSPAVDEPDEPTAPELEPLDGASCLIGNWYLNNESFKTGLEAAGGDVQDITGWVVVTYRDDGSTTTLYDEWATVVVQDGAEATILRNGQDDGSYEVLADGTLSVTETSANSVVTMTMNRDGQSMTSQIQPQSSSWNGGAISCDAEKLKLTADGQTSELLREH